jgi:hypothetical protein
MNETDLNKHMSESKSIPARDGISDTLLKSMAVRNQKTQKIDMYVKIYKENYLFLNTSVYNDIRTHMF